ncbi:uncharacterized protein LOC6557437 [Drosophila grimshawi]|uniref:GH16087 n=1 Tax=Drosophila grimshawi TaxID=7222 RepID=B4J361_DROGR|nr:uncharacterized protein LOC6557437 [Drosophila grimshawi]EDV96132.1 GH16087 [Drosophila grimshawi]
MSATNNQSDQTEESVTKQVPFHVNTELHSDIEKLMKPRIEMLQKIVTTRMSSEAPTANGIETEGYWWPECRIYSPIHYMSEMNDFMSLTRNALICLTEELQVIQAKFQDLNESEPSEKLGPLVSYAEKCYSYCKMQFYPRNRLHHKIIKTKNIEDHTILKIIDEIIFTTLQMRMTRLKSMIEDFCALVEVKWDLNEKDAAAAAGATSPNETSV